MNLGGKKKRKGNKYNLSQRTFLAKKVTISEYIRTRQLLFGPSHSESKNAAHFIELVCWFRLG